MITGYNYDIASQLSSITNTPVNLNNYYTSYDNVGNRLSMTDSNGSHNYTYDNLYRLTDVSNPTEHYSYDPVGNRNPLTQAYDITKTGNRLLDDGTYTYTYDHDGNMTSKIKKIGGETTNYSYNSEDQLVGVTTPTQTISYQYDTLGRRIEKNVGGTITRYIYDGEDIIQEYAGNNQVIATYHHGPWIDEPICLEKNNQKYYYITDGLGSVIALVDSNGNVAQTYRYDSFGNIISQTGSLTQPYTYTGREYDSEIGLYYYRARYYDPNTGCFLQEDPIWDTNLYAYVLNNPLNLIDPYGLLRSKTQEIVNEFERNTNNISEAAYAARARRESGDKSIYLAEAEHYLFVKSEVYNNPSLAPVYVAGVPVYTTSKGLLQLFPLMKGASPASLDEIYAGWQGIWDALTKRYLPYMPCQ